jgi:hypothetical protein
MTTTNEETMWGVVHMLTGRQTDGVVSWHDSKEAAMERLNAIAENNEGSERDEAGSVLFRFRGGELVGAIKDTFYYRRVTRTQAEAHAKRHGVSVNTLPMGSKS